MCGMVWCLCVCVVVMVVWWLVLVLCVWAFWVGVCVLEWCGGVLWGVSGWLEEGGAALLLASGRGCWVGGCVVVV